MPVDCFPEAPTDWPRQAFGSVAEVSPPYKLDKAREYPFVEMAAVGENFRGIQRFDRRKPESSGLARFKLNDILFAKITPSPENGKVALVSQLPDEYGLGSTEFIVLSPRNGNDPRFVYALACSNPVRGRAIGRMEGSTGRLRVTEDTFRKWLRVSVPPPEEQKAIADVLDACDAARSAIENKLTAAQRLKTALMQQLFTRGIPGRHKKFTKTKWIHAPAKWDVLPLREMAEIVSGFTMGRDLSGNELVSLPYLTVINVQEGRLDLSCVEPVTVKASEVEDLLLRPNDVLMTEGGDRDKLGRGCIWRGELEKCVFQNHIFRIRFKPDTYLPELFHFLLQSWQAKNYFYAHAKQTSNLCTINKRELRRFPVPKPQPDEQNEMLALLKTAEANIQAIEAELKSLQRLKTSLLQNLLTGKVRIKMEG